MTRISAFLTAIILSSCVSTTFAGGGGGGGRGGRGGGGQGGGGGNQNNFNNNNGGAQGGGGRGGFNNGANANGGNLGAILGLNMSFYQNEYNIILQQLTLTDDAKPKVQTDVTTMNSELQTFLQNSQANLGNGNRGGGRGGRGGRAQAAPQAAFPPADPGQLTPEQVKIRDDFLSLADQHQLKIDADLTDDQKLTWETYKLNLWLKPHIEILQLADDQKDKIKSYVTDTAKAITVLTDGKDIETLEGRLFRKIVGDILTEPQAAVVFQQQEVGTPGTMNPGALAGNFAGNGNGQFNGGPGGGGGGRGGRGGGGGGFGNGGGGGGFGGGNGGGGGGFGGGGRGGRGGGGGFGGPAAGAAGGAPAATQGGGLP